jgi:hypothetical protein
MSKNFHTAYVDGTGGTPLNAEGIAGNDATTPTSKIGLAGLDSAIGKQGNHAFATMKGHVTMHASSNLIYYPAMHVFHHRDTDGSIVRNLINANTTGLAVANTDTTGFVAYVTLSETIDSILSVSTADYSALPSLFKDGTKLVLFGRSPSTTAGRRSQLFYVGLMMNMPLQAEATLLNATTSTAVAFSSSPMDGVVMPSADYHVICTQVVGTNTNPYVLNSNRTTTGFTISHASATTGDKVFWQIV